MAYAYDARIRNDYLNNRYLKKYALRHNLLFFGCIALFGDDILYEVYKEQKHGMFILIDSHTRKTKTVHPDGLIDVRYRTGAQCSLCKSIVYSSHNRHLQKCRCGSLMVDGGQEMLRISTEDNYEIVTVDMLSRSVV